MDYQNEKPEGFTTVEGLAAMAGLALALGSGAYGLITHPLILVLYIGGVALFFGIYGVKLCAHCTKNCPCNPDMKFWQRMAGK